MRLPHTGEVEQHEKPEDEMVEIGHYGSLDSPSMKQFNAESPQHVNMRQRQRRSSAVALEQMRIDTGHTRQSIILHERRKRSTILGSYATIGNAPVLQLSDFRHGENSASRHSLFGGANESMRSLFGEAINEGEYTLGEVTLLRTSIWLNVFTVIACFAVLNMQVLLPPYIASLGMPPSMGGRALAMFGLGDFLSNTTLGAVADKVGARRLFTFAFFNLSFLFFLWPYCTTGASLSTIAFFYGYFCCTISSMPIIVLADAYGESSSEHILALNGIRNMFKCPGYLLGPPIAGILVEVSGGYNLAATCSGVTTLIGTMMLLMIPSPEEQQRQLSDSFQ